MKALFAGSFDPPSLGHVNLIERALACCDELLIGVAHNSGKKSLLTVEERVASLQKLTRARVTAYTGLTVDFAKKNGITLLIRGLRNASDMDKEFEFAFGNRHLGNMETLFLRADPRYMHLSSSLIREIYLSGGSLEGLVPQDVMFLLEKK